MRTTRVVRSKLVKEINCRIGFQMCTLRSQAIYGFLAPARFGRVVRSFVGFQEEYGSNLKGLSFRIRYTKKAVVWPSEIGDRIKIPLISMN